MFKEYERGVQNLCCIMEFLWGQCVVSKLSMRLFYYLGWSRNESLCVFFLIPDHSHFQLLCGLKAQPYICDPVSSEPAWPPGEHLEVTWALLVFSRVCGSHPLCWNRLCVPLPLFSYPSTTVFTPCLVVQVPTSSFLVDSVSAFVHHPPPFKKNSKELFFPKPLDTRIFLEVWGSELAQKNPEWVDHIHADYLFKGRIFFLVLFWLVIATATPVSEE